jgi:serine/threonine protein kinase/Tfp pilus assembly protein PilF
MKLTPGTILSSYEILGPLGAGGMGEVYRARDTRLGRTVAIKSLPHAFATDASRLSRFEREARIVATLNHPNIAAIYGLQDVEGEPYLVLEFVDGETLAARLSRGSLSVGETLEIGCQVASAIEAAHEQGIVHRDLKPGNVMLTAAGTVKVLDFGLARGDQPAASASSDFTATPTVALSNTGDGVVLGTAPYMSPEQARGKPVDRRTDVWAFGCLLFECLGGRQAFDGETVSDVIARILEREPDWTALPPTLPAGLRDVVRRCLIKEANERPRDIGDLRRELRGLMQGQSSPSGFHAAAGEPPSLAVLYFENLANDRDSEYFCSGITEDILTDLSKIKGLRVASRNAVLRYRGTQPELSKVASDLGVKAVLEGSVRRSGDRVRITTQLVNAADGFQLWAERYDRTLLDVFAVQEEIASAIATALRVALTPAEAGNLVQNRPNDVQAYDLYLRGREFYGEYSATSLPRALELFQEAIAIDPGYALAWAGVADCHGQMVAWGIAKEPTEALRTGLEAARRAISLNPRLAEGHKAESLVLRYSGDHDGARAALVRAVQANPRYTPALINLGVQAFTSADLAGAERFIRRALDIDPQEPFAKAWLLTILKLTGRNDDVLSQVEELRRMSDKPFYVTGVHMFRAWISLDRGDNHAIRQALESGTADGADPANLRCVEAALAVREGRAEEGRGILRELESSHATLGVGALIIGAGAALRLGDSDQAMRFMTRNIVGDMGPVVIRLEPGLLPLINQEPFRTKASPAMLTWPLEAPMMSAATHAAFREVRIRSGLPAGSDPGIDTAGQSQAR